MPQNTSQSTYSQPDKGTKHGVLRGFALTLTLTGGAPGTGETAPAADESEVAQTFDHTFGTDGKQFQRIGAAALTHVVTMGKHDAVAFAQTSLSK